MKTYAQLKKDLQVGKRLKVIYHATRQEQEKRQFDNPYFIKLSLAKQSGLEYMVNETPTKRFSAYEQKVYDSSVKGAKFISFEILED